MIRVDSSALVLLALAGSVLSNNAVAADVEVPRPAEACERLRTLATPQLVVEAAQLMVAGPLASPPNSTQAESLPEHCRLQGLLNPHTGARGEKFGIGFELRLPSRWNGRFVFQGGGGLDGVLNPAVGSAGRTFSSALARGFAVVSSDGGHRGASMLDARFGFDQQARLDYAFNALDKVTLQAKAVIRSYYGRAPDRSYFLGCSNGGRQGMMAAQRWPEYFDGIVAGAPTFNLSRIVMNQVWNIQTIARIAPRDADGNPLLAQAFTEAQLQGVAAAVEQACDAKDGLADGMINDVKACNFDPGVLECAAGSTDAACLSKQQVTALRDLAGGVRNSRGESLYGRYPFDTGIASSQWRRMHLGTKATGKSDAADVTLGFETMRLYMLTPPDANFDPMKFDFDRDLPRIRQMQALGDADATYLESFARRGKLILYHGVSDQGMATGALTDWYDRVQADNGANTHDWARLFLVPGMTHCGGGRSTDRFDMLQAVQDWVEKGRAPDRVLATGAAFPGVSRPLCPYPKVARYQGGDASSESSFKCAQ